MSSAVGGSLALAVDVAGEVAFQEVTRTYFANGLLQRLTTTDGAASPTTLEEHTLSYTRDGIYLNGNRAQDVFKLLGPDATAPCRTTTCTASWTYDGRGRVLQEVNGTGTTIDFTLDVVGNVVQEKQNGTVTRTATYAAQQLESETDVGGTTRRYLYDQSGNIDCITASGWTSAACPNPGNGSLLVDYAYDYKNRLSAFRQYSSGSLSDSADYSYDALDRPVAQSEIHPNENKTTNFVYVGASNAVGAETTTGTGAGWKSYTYDARGRRATLTENGSRYSYVYDPHGSVSLLLDQNRNVKASYGYTAYGTLNLSVTKTASGFNAATNLYTYTAKRFDGGSNTLNMGARRYSASTRRFLQQDLYYGALSNLSLSSDPISGNRYALAGGNPANFTEVDGHRVDLGDGLDSAPGGGSGPTTCYVCSQPGILVPPNPTCHACSGLGPFAGPGAEPSPIALKVNQESYSAEKERYGNGCGPGGSNIASRIIAAVAPEGFAGADLSAACEVHDICYAAWGYWKDYCDDTFVEMMRDECLESWFWKIPKPGTFDCLVVAGAYYRAVRDLGGGAFVAAQVAECPRATENSLFARRPELCEQAAKRRSRRRD